MKPLAAGDVAGAVGMDAGALSGLRRQAKAAPGEALSAAASQFEALFVQNLLKAMREALPQDGPLASDSMRAYTGMFDAQLAQEISKRGLGLGRMLERQLGATVKPDGLDAAKAVTPGVNPGRAGEGYVRTGALWNKATSGPLVPGAAALAPRAAAGAAGMTAATAATATPSAGAVPDRVREFVTTMRPHAEAAARAVGVPADVLLAQAGLETGWGRHQPRTQDGSASHNLLGIKAGSRWTGATVLAKTTEYVAGAITRTVDKFRSYASYADAFADFARLITGNARYADAVAHAGDPAAYAKGLQKGGYATDPLYADKLTRAIALVSRDTTSASAPKVPAGGADNRIRKA